MFPARKSKSPPQVFIHPIPVSCSRFRTENISCCGRPNPTHKTSGRAARIISHDAGQPTGFPDKDFWPWCMLFHSPLPAHQGNKTSIRLFHRFSQPGGRNQLWQYVRVKDFPRITWRQRLQTGCMISAVRMTLRNSGFLPASEILCPFAENISLGT